MFAGNDEAEVAPRGAIRVMDQRWKNSGSPQRCLEFLSFGWTAGDNSYNRTRRGRRLKSGSCQGVFYEFGILTQAHKSGSVRSQDVDGTERGVGEGQGQGSVADEKAASVQDGAAECVTAENGPAVGSQGFA